MRLAALVAAAWLAAAAQASAHAQDTLERDVKAAFLYNFTKYIVWPAHAFQQPSDPFRLCVVADQDFRDSVQSLIAGERVGERPLEMVAPQPGQAGGCHILFVSKAQSTRMASLFAEAVGRPVLTVVEDPGAFGSGVGVLLDREGSRVRFDINLAATGRAGLTVDTKLVRVARQVRQGSAR